MSFLSLLDYITQTNFPTLGNSTDFYFSKTSAIIVSV